MDMRISRHPNCIILLCYSPEYYHGPIDRILSVLYNLLLQSVDGDE
jgi:hypothetical protein